jgi:hypothetical protein
MGGLILAFDATPFHAAINELSRLARMQLYARSQHEGVRMPSLQPYQLLRSWQYLTSHFSAQRVSTTTANLTPIVK